MSNDQEIEIFVLQNFLSIRGVDAFEVATLEDEEKLKLYENLSRLTSDLYTNNPEAVDEIAKHLLRLVNETISGTPPANYTYTKDRQENFHNLLQVFWETGYLDPLDYIRRAPVEHKPPPGYQLLKTAGEIFEATKKVIYP